MRCVRTLGGVPVCGLGGLVCGSPALEVSEEGCASVAVECSLRGFRVVEGAKHALIDA